jgi:hypothetical protein
MIGNEPDANSYLLTNFERRDFTVEEVTCGGGTVIISRAQYLDLRRSRCAHPKDYRRD